MDFKKYAGIDLAKWKELIGCKIEHTSYSIGTIKKVTPNEKEPGVILHTKFSKETVKLKHSGFGKYYFIIPNKKSELLLNKYEGLLKPESGFLKAVTHCWNCKEVIFNTNKKCLKCGGYFCESCGSCLCNYEPFI